VSLPWFRVDTNLGTHEKILALLDDSAAPGIKYRAAWSYVVAIGWSVDSETDGRLTRAAFPYIHATPATARLLVRYGLWDEEPPGYRIHNYAHRQPLARTSSALREERRRAGSKSACLRWHGPDCWIEPEGCSRA
jgi:hypothetical protein